MTGPLRLVYRTLSLSHTGRQVLGPDLNRSESRWGQPVPLCFYFKG